MTELYVSYKIFTTTSSNNHVLDKKTFKAELLKKTYIAVIDNVEGSLNFGIKTIKKNGKNVRCYTGIGRVE
jgi:hypothetical protein